LAEAGANICFVQRNPQDGVSSSMEIFNTVQALGVTTKIVHCDLADLTSVKTVFQSALMAMGGRIHILVNCAGIQRRSPSVEFSEKDWDDVCLPVLSQSKLNVSPIIDFTYALFGHVLLLSGWLMSFFLQVLDVNLKSVWLLCQAAGKHMVPLREGKIINFCSLLSFQGGITVPAYAAAKGALGQVTKALSNEWSQHNVQVNGIVPGYVATDMYVFSPPFDDCRFSHVSSGPFFRSC
jgi:2-dehydro-3-deoxy-D-gluconate 5-dehydrogenase